MYNFFSKRLNGNRKGFTLVELLVVMAILAVLIAIAVMNMGTTTISAKVSKHNSQVREIHSAASMWYANNVEKREVKEATTTPYTIPNDSLKSFFNAGAIPKPEVGTVDAFTVTVTSTGKVKVTPALFKVNDAGEAVADPDATKVLQGE